MDINSLSGASFKSPVAQASPAIQKGAQGVPFDSYLDTAMKNKDLILEQVRTLSALGNSVTPEQVAQYAGQLVGKDQLDRKRKFDFDDAFNIKQTMKDMHMSSSLAQAVPQELNQLEFPDNLGPAEVEESPYSPVTPESAFSGGVANDTLNITPFQFFLDKSLEFLTRLTMMEIRTDSLMELYAKGKASIEEITIEKAKVSVAVSFATTMLSQITQAFKEIQNMQI